MKFKFTGQSLLTLLMIGLIFIISGAIFLVLVAFGLFGLSRLLIFFNLAEFTYNVSFFDNLFYYGSYILSGYFLLIFIEYIFDQLQQRYPEADFFQGFKYHIFVVLASSIIFYIFVQMNYQYVHINFFVITLVIAILYSLTELFYPGSENLNQSDEEDES